MFSRFLLPSIIITNSPLRFSIFSFTSFIVPLINSSCIFVISLAKTTCLFSNIFSKSLIVFKILCGASYKIIVLLIFFISFNFSFLNFLFNGKNPKKVNSFVFKPEQI